MDKLAAMRTFVAVVEEGGFSAAARALGLSRSVVNRQVIQLEDRLKTQLLTRNTRNVAATETGIAYYERCTAILADIVAAEEELSSQTSTPRGMLKVNAPMSFGTLHLASCVAEYCKRHPQVEVQLQLDDRFLDPVENGYDLTIRIAALQDSSLIARKLAPARLVLTASPAFLSQHGPIDRPERLSDLPCLHYGHVTTGSQWQLNGPDGQKSIAVRGPFCSNNGEAVAEAACQGLGVAPLPTFIASAYLRDGRLVTVLDDWRPREIAIYAIYAPSRHLPPKVRTFIDFLVESFGGTPYWDA